MSRLLPGDAGDLKFSKMRHEEAPVRLHRIKGGTEDSGGNEDEGGEGRATRSRAGAAASRQRSFGGMAPSRPRRPLRRPALRAGPGQIAQLVLRDVVLPDVAFEQSPFFRSGLLSFTTTPTHRTGTIVKADPFQIENHGGAGVEYTSHCKARLRFAQRPPAQLFERRARIQIVFMR